MDRRGNSSVSSSDSFYFQLLPNHFKVEHGFAKTMKPNTSYRLLIFKGLQKTDEMAEPLKAKLIGGKILFDPVSLNFSLPLYTPARNIQFTVKVLETKPNEKECQIAIHKIKSGDLVKKFKNDDKVCSREQINLFENFSFVFEVFVHNSKSQLDRLVKEHREKCKIQSRGPKTPRKNEFASDISQSDQWSQSGSVNKRKISRKRGHDGKLRSRQGSRDNSEAGSQKSARSSRKSFGPFPHAKKDEHFLHSPKKVSPPKVDDEEIEKKNKRENYVTVGRKDSQRSDIKGSGVKNPIKSKRQPQDQINRPQSARKEHFSRKIGGSPSTGKIQTPKNQENKVHNLELKTDQNMFSVEQRTREQMKQQRPPLANKVSKTKTQQIQSEQNLPNQPISKPSASRQLEEENQAKNQAKADASIKSKDSKAKVSTIQIKEAPTSKGPKQKVEFMKASVRIHDEHKTEEDEEEAAGKEYNGMKDRLFYVFFTVISMFLFWNALTPSRKV